MKKKILLVLPLLVLASCVTDQPTSNPTSNPTSSQTTDTSNPTTSAPTTAPLELAMTLEVDGVAKENKIYELLLGDSLTITPVFNDPSRAEDVTFNATESGYFGDSTSTNVTLDGGTVTAVGRADKIKITATSTSGLTDYIEIKTVAMADEEFPNIIEKLNTAATLETNASGGSYTYNSLSATFTVATDGSVDVEENNNDTITHKYSLKDGDKYYDVTTNEDGTSVITASVKETKPSSFGYYVAKINSMTTQNGLVSTIKYLLENGSYFQSSSAYNHAEIMFLEEDNTYLIDSEYVVDNWGTKTFTQLYIEVSFNDDGALSYFTYDSQSFDKTAYDFENEEFLSENPTPTSSTVYEGELNYETKSDASSFDLSILYFTDYNILLKDSKGNEGTSFEVGTLLDFNFGDTTSPSTASSSIDKLTFTSSSNPEVANINADNKVECLTEGSTTLTFTSAKGVEKTIELTVTAPQAPTLTEAQIKEKLTTTTYVKTDVFDASVIKNKLTFTETQGTYEVVDSSTITFDYTISGTSLTISNSSDASAFQKLSAVEFNDDYSTVTLTFKSSFGSSTVELKANN